MFHKVKIVHAAWLRDRTWPVGMEAPPSSDSEEKLNDERIHSNPSTIQFAPTTVTGSSEVNEITAL